MGTMILTWKWRGIYNRSDWQLYHGKSNSQYTSQVRLEVWTVNQCYPTASTFLFFFALRQLSCSAPLQCQTFREMCFPLLPVSFALLTLIRTVPMTSTVRNWTPVLLICAAGVKAHKSPLLCSWSLKVQPTGSEAQLNLQTAEDGGR